MKTKTLSIEIELLKEEELDEAARRVIEAAKKATENSYAPYSKFQVGAAALLDNKLIVSGNNQENIAYPSGLCAERITIFAANANHPGNAILSLAIAAQTGGRFTPKPITPCGACRQVFCETEQRQKCPMEILLYGSEQIIRIRKAADLLPLAFEF